MTIKEYFLQIGKIPFEGTKSKTRWLSIIMNLKRS